MADMPDTEAELFPGKILPRLIEAQLAYAIRVASPVFISTEIGLEENLEAGKWSEKIEKSVDKVLLVYYYSLNQSILNHIGILGIRFFYF